MGVRGAEIPGEDVRGTEIPGEGVRVHENVTTQQFNKISMNKIKVIRVF